MVNSSFILRHVICFFCIFNIYGQDKTNSALNNWYDNATEKENLDINNGKIQNILYRSLPTKHPYLLDEKFVKGNIVTTENTFYDLDLRYDINTDELIMKPFGEQQNRSVILSPENIKSFEINNKKFINLNKSKANNPEIVSGYYEVSLTNNSISFYIKYHKDRKELLLNESVKSDFYEVDEFIVFVNNTYNIVKSRRDLTKLFPDYESNINNFYNLNTSEQKDDKTLFMGSVMKYISNLISNKQN